MRELAMLCPSSGRPYKADELLASFAGATVAELVLVLDADDELRPDYPVAATTFVVQSRGMVHALNRAAAYYAGGRRAVGFLGDDHRPRTPGWDVRLLEELEELGTGFVYGNDLLQGEAMPTAVAMTSDIVRALGYMAPPELEHLNVDIAWLEWGRRIDRIRYLDDVILEHLHPANGKADLDAGYERVNSVEMVARDGEAWDRYVRGDLDEDVLKLQDLIGAAA
jgi:hypothetical protein